MQGYKTLIGLAIAAVPNIANLFGYEVAPGFSEQASQIVDGLISVAGLALALYGRIVAQGPLWFGKKSN